MKSYFDAGLLKNPLFEYFKWISAKIYYQCKYWGNHLRIDYQTFIRRCRFGRYNYVGKQAVLGDCLIGDFSYISDHCVLTHTTIGKFCSIGPNVKTAPGRHPTSKFVSTHPSTFSNPSFLKKSFTTGPMFAGNLNVQVGNDVWIGANSIILDGVTIHDGAVIGANSLVTRDVEAYHIVGGTPAKFIKKRFSDEEIALLGKFEWWNKSDEWLQENIWTFWDIKDFTRHLKHDHE